MQDEPETACHCKIGSRAIGQRGELSHQSVEIAIDGKHAKRVFARLAGGPMLRNNSGWLHTIPTRRLQIEMTRCKSSSTIFGQQLGQTVLTCALARNLVSIAALATTPSWQ